MIPNLVMPSVEGFNFFLVKTQEYHKCNTFQEMELRASFQNALISMMTLCPGALEKQHLVITLVGGTGFFHYL
jgi:hypothetical protein